MAGDPPPQRPDDGAAGGANQGWTAVSYLIGGILVWGGFGWAVDKWLLHSGGIAIAVGTLVGAAGGVYLIVRHFGRQTEGQR